MKNRSLCWTLALILMAAACGEGTKEESPGEVLARDSSLASDLKQADTSAFAEAADVAMAFDPDSAMPPVTAKPAVSACAWSQCRDAPATAAPTTTVPIARTARRRRSTPAARAPDASRAGDHPPDPIPTTGCRPPRRWADRDAERRGASRARDLDSGEGARRRATAGGSDEPCASPASPTSAAA